MRTVLGTTAAVLERRGIALERLAQVTLRRDAYAAEPGPTVTLAIGERTTYRAGAWLLDTFERLQLGASYPPWGGTIGLALVAGQVRPVGFGVPGMVTHPLALPPDAWAAVTLAALSGPTAVVGVLLRASDDAAYRILATSAGQTVVERLEAGTPTALATVPTPWRAGDVLRVELAGPRLRVSRDQIRVADVTDPGAALPGRAAGMVAGRADPTDAAALTSFVGGEARQEYLGAGLDLGDVQTVLGQPVAFDVTLSNLAPLGGAARFAALLRHGQNTAGTYDLMRGDVRILTAVAGGTAPLTTGVGVLDGPTLTEDTARLTCRGRDAFLTPQLAPGPVTYVPGPPPGGLTPLPADPCAPSTPPTIEAGPVPPEPVDPPTHEGVGPEAPDAPAPAAGTLYGLFSLARGPALVVPAVEILTFASSEAWSPATDGEMNLDEGWTTEPSEQVVSMRALFRTSAWAGSHVTGEHFPGLRILVEFIYGGGPPVTESPPTVVEIPETRLRLVEYGIPNPDFNPDLPESPENPAYIRPDSQAAVEDFLAAMTWARWTDDADPFILGTLAEYTFPARTDTLAGGVGTPGQVEVSDGLALAGEAFGQFVGAARWIGLRVPEATRTPLAGFAWFASVCTARQTDGLDDKLTIATPPP